jgi:hypothetical protein
MTQRSPTQSDDHRLQECNAKARKAALSGAYVQGSAETETYRQHDLKTNIELIRCPLTRDFMALNVTVENYRLKLTYAASEMGLAYILAANLISSLVLILPRG